MTKKVPLIISLLATGLAFAQNVEEKISKIYYSDSDIIKIKYSTDPRVFDVDLSENDTVSPGANISKGIVMNAFIGKDTLTIKGDSYPFGKKSIVTIQTPKRKTVVVFRYNASSSIFSEKYMKKNEVKISFEIPEVYELANIILTLSPSGTRIIGLPKDTDYYKAVEEYFRPYSDHPVFKKLIFKTDTEFYQNYYEFRENSFMYEFKGNKIVKGEKYNYVFGQDWTEFSNLFTELLPLVQDFSNQSNFKKFYRKNKKFYSTDISRTEELLPIQNMWTWLEKQFPEKVNRYKIVFSPLIAGSHSTQKFIGQRNDTEALYTETVMFICDGHRYDSQKELTELEKQGLISGVVFTEIDHNYVNPVTSKYEKEIAEIFNSKIWSEEKTGIYNSPESVFNEYMTHSVFCLWVLDNYDKKTADLVIKHRVEMNAGRRGFVKFKEFNDELLKLRKENPEKTVAELYPEMLEWAKLENENVAKS